MCILPKCPAPITPILNIVISVLNLGLKLGNNYVRLFKFNKSYQQKVYNYFLFFLLYFSRASRALSSLSCCDLEIGIINAVQKGACTKSQIVLKEGTKVQLNLWENLSHGNMSFMSAEKVFSKRQRSKSEFYMPNIEHLFEFAVLHNYLDDQGLPIQYLNYFLFIGQVLLLNIYQKLFSEDFPT